MKQQYTVLILSNCLSDRQTYQQFLSQSAEYGYQTLEATFEQAETVFQQAQLDAVLLDTTTIDSIECSATLNRINQKVTIVTIVLDEAIALQFLKSGAKDYIIKSKVTPDVLQHTLQSAMLRTRVDCITDSLHQQLQQQQAALRSSEERLQLALEVACMGAWDWNIVTDELSWSPNYAGLIGFDPDQCPTTLAGWAEPIHPDDRAQAHATLMRSLHARTDLNNEYRIIKPNGEIRWLSCQGRLECNAAGEPIRMVGVTQDVTDRQQRAQLLKLEQAAREEAETANQSKDEFLAIVTHELRTPLNAILGWARLLRSRNLDPSSIDRALETIERNAQTQSQLIEDLLDISRIIRGRLTLKQVSVNLYAVISAAIEGVKLSAEAKQVQLEFTPMTDLTISGDPKRLQQILLNLLTNAIKFTPEHGKVTVQLAIEQTPSPTARITVTDTGIGISPEFLPHIFDRFRQDEARSIAGEGLGLGLAIVRQLVELHQGTVEAQSKGENQGSIFIVRFPLV